MTLRNEKSIPRTGLRYAYCLRRNERFVIFKKEDEDGDSECCT